MDEFQSIAELFAPLALPEGARLRDDAAFLAPRPGQELVITADAVVEGVHFLPGTAPELVARKLLRVNLSDLAAKAAEPFGYILTVAWPSHWGRDARAAFAQGLAVDQKSFGLGLLGGDTVSTNGPMTASVTALGYAPRAVRRSGARPGDLVLVSGTIGDGLLGLWAAQGELEQLGEAERAAAALRYRLPEPRVRLRDLLRRHAHAAIDVSDGLIADLGHLARASEVGFALELEQLPLSAAGRAWVGRNDEGVALEQLASGGDDYEIAFTIAASELEATQAASAAVGVPTSVVGRVASGTGVRVTHLGQERTPVPGGWRHG